MRKAIVLYKGEEAGILCQHNDGSFSFRYHDHWMADSSKKEISLTMAKNKQEYRSMYLFPFFYNMLPEGNNKKYICESERIDKTDDFTLLTTVAVNDSIGAVTVKPI